MAFAIPTADVLRAANQRRLAQLELRAARQGYDAPPEVLNEIDEIRAALGEADGRTADPASEPDRYKALAYQIRGLTILADETRSDVRHLIRVVAPVAFVALAIAIVAIVVLAIALALVLA